MAFEVPPTRVVSRRTRWAAVPVIAAALVITAVAFASKTAPGSSTAAVPTSGLPLPSPTAGVAGLDGSAAAASGLVPGIVSPSFGPDGGLPIQSEVPGLAERPVPGALRCMKVDATSCVSMAEAALRTVPGAWPKVRRASVWRSLLCDSSLDCPPTLLRSVVPLGSVVLELADGGPPVWVNVVGWRTLTESSAALQLQAWIVRS